MNITLEEIAPCRRRMRVEIPVNEVNSEIESVTAEFQKAARLPGFRPGKAPKDVVAKKYIKEIDDEVRGNLIPKAFQTAVKEKNLRIANALNVEEVNFQRGISMTFSAIVDIEPDFSLPEYKGLVLPEASVEATEEEVETFLNTLREQQAEFKNVEGRPVAAEDYVVMTFSTDCEGKTLADIAPEARVLSGGNNAWVSLADTAVPAGLKDGLVGMQVGEKKEISAVFPEDFSIEALRGKTTLFTVELTAIKSRVLPEWNDELAQKIASQPLDSLRTRARQLVSENKKERVRRGQYESVIEKLLAASNFDLPESVLNAHTRQAIRRIVDSNSSQGVNPQELESKKDEIFAVASKNAESTVRADMLLQRIAEAEKIEASQEEIQQRLVQMSYRYQMPMDKFMAQVRKNNAIGGIVDEIVAQKTLDFIIEHAKFEPAA